MSLRFLHKHPDNLTEKEDAQLVEIMVWYHEKVRKGEFRTQILV